MGRQSLRIIMVLGALVTLVGGTGIFAVFTDRATTGTNTAESGERPKAAELRIARASLLSVEGSETVIDCSAYSSSTDDLATGLLTVSNLQPYGSVENVYVCLDNAGAAPLNLTATAIDLVDGELGCTGDESLAGDAACDPVLDPSATGELSSLLMVTVEEVEWMLAPGPMLPEPVVLSSTTIALDELATTAIPVGTAPLGQGGTRYVHVEIAYPGDTPEALVQIAQSDQVTWRFAFDGTVP